MTIKAHFDGKVIIPDEPLDLEKDQQLQVTIQPAPASAERYITGTELAHSDIVGMWKDREDIKDSTEFVNELRRRIERREL
jgi:hypothetical protein